MNSRINKIAAVLILGITLLYPLIQSVHIDLKHPLIRQAKFESDSNCIDDLTQTTCNKLVSEGNCDKDLDLASVGCRKSCGLCKNGKSMNGLSSISRDAPTCQDKLPTCDKFSGAGMQAACCTPGFTDFFNQTCPKTCKFCSEISLVPANPIQGMPGFGVPGAPPSPTVVTQQNPCDLNPSKPPTASINPGR